MEYWIADCKGYAHSKDTSWRTYLYSSDVKKAPS